MTSAILNLNFSFFTGLAAACDDGNIRLWSIPEEGGLVSPTNTPEVTLTVGNDKVTIVKFHPLAKNVVLTALLRSGLGGEHDRARLGDGHALSDLGSWLQVVS